MFERIRHYRQMCRIAREFPHVTMSHKRWLLWIVTGVEK